MRHGTGADAVPCCVRMQCTDNSRDTYRVLLRCVRSCGRNGRTAGPGVGRSAGWRCVLRRRSASRGSVRWVQLSSCWVALPAAGTATATATAIRRTAQWLGMETDTTSPRPAGDVAHADRATCDVRHTLRRPLREQDRRRPRHVAVIHTWSRTACFPGSAGQQDAAWHGMAWHGIHGVTARPSTHATASGQARAIRRAAVGAAARDGGEERAGRAALPTPRRRTSRRPDLRRAGSGGPIGRLARFLAAVGRGRRHGLRSSGHTRPHARGQRTSIAPSPSTGPRPSPARSYVIAIEPRLFSFLFPPPPRGTSARRCLPGRPCRVVRGYGEEPSASQILRTASKQAEQSKQSKAR